MPHKRPPTRVLIIAGLLVLIGGYYGIRALTARASGALQASGTIEAVTVNVSPEMAGKVAEVLVEEGQAVKSGDPLLRLDGGLLARQRQVAAANLDSATAGAQTAQNALETAKAQYQVVLAAALAQDKQSRLSGWFSKDPKQFEQPGWYFSRAEQIEAAQAQVDVALQAAEQAQAALTDVNQSLDKAEFLAAEERLLSARLAYLIARDVNNRAQNSTTSHTPVGVYNSTHCGTNEGYRLRDGHLTNLIYTCTGDPQLADAGQALYDAAQAELDDAQQAYDDLLSTQAAEDVLAARAEVAVAQERYYSALDYLHALQTGDQSAAVSAARGSMEQARAAADQAQAAAQQARANLALLDEQVAKLTISAPMDGVILTRNVEVGEFVQPGATAMTMGDLSNLTITVYVPNDRLREVKVGQKAVVKIDVESGPSPDFTAEIIRVADQAEFTPRNVQTAEGRSGTVWAVKLKVSDSEGILKIGMPAVVTFQ